MYLWRSSLHVYGFIRDGAELPTSHLELNRAHAIRTEEGQYFIANLEPTTELSLLREIQDMELSFIVSNDHRSRNTGSHGYNFSLNRRKCKSGIGQGDYGDDQEYETSQYSEYKPEHGNVSFLSGSDARKHHDC